MNIPVDPRKTKQFASWVISRDDDMDEWQALLNGVSDFGPVTFGEPKGAAQTSGYYESKGWVGLYCEVPEKKKSSYVTREPVRIKGDGI